MPYLAPRDITEALTFLRDTDARIIAGCTDYFPGRRPGQIDENLLDVTCLDQFRGIVRTADGWRIGAAATWSEVIAASLPAVFDALRLASREIGSVQIQNRGTVAGNLCNASPAADGVPPLLVLDAEVEIVSLAGTRTLPLSAFITGVRSVDLAPGEIVAAIRIPDASPNAKSAFLKLGSRTHLVISIAMAAAVVEEDGGTIKSAKLAVGSCSPVAQRLPALEESLAGRTAEDLRAMDFAEHGALSPLNPISDVRGSSEYRLDVVAEICRRVVMQALGEE